MIVEKGVDFLIDKESLPVMLEAIARHFTLVGPVGEGVRAEFREISALREMNLDYVSTMTPPGKAYLFSPKEELASFRLTPEGPVAEETRMPSKKYALIGVHACDVNAIFYMDRVFMGDLFKDPFYQARRQNTFIAALNCKGATDLCFCHLMGAGPYLKAQTGYDMLLTDMGDEYLVEIKSDRAGEAFSMGGRMDFSRFFRRPEEDVWGRKDRMEAHVLEGFTKTLKTDGLDEMFFARQDHPAIKTTADTRCLSCSNCVMVCPTCFCHDVYEETGLSLTRARRVRRWDACQDYKFSAMHGCNPRAERRARLRQFVFHKLNYSAQFGMRATVGCGRCIRWCPTGIDLTEISEAMRR